MRFSWWERFCLFAAIMSMQMVLIREYSREDVPNVIYDCVFDPLCELGTIPFQVCETIIPKSGAVLFEQGGCRVFVKALWWNTFYEVTAGLLLWLGIRRTVMAFAGRLFKRSRAPVNADT
jgi:hypothetical protein